MPDTSGAWGGSSQWRQCCSKSTKTPQHPPSNHHCLVFTAAEGFCGSSPPPISPLSSTLPFFPHPHPPIHHPLLLPLPYSHLLQPRTKRHTCYEDGCAASDECIRCIHLACQVRSDACQWSSVISFHIEAFSSVSSHVCPRLVHSGGCGPRIAERVSCSPPPLWPPLCNG